MKENYAVPEIEIIEVEVEQGFAASDFETSSFENPIMGEEQSW